MRKFLIAALALLFIAAAAYYGVYEGGLYLPFGQRETTAVFQARGDRLARWDNGSWTAFPVRGVEVTASLPGHYTADYAPKQADYLRWMEEIGAMGANTLYVSLIMDDDFYNAFYAYNEERETPMYLVQGVSVSDEVNANTETAFAGGILTDLIHNGKTLVDVIHGRRDIPDTGISGSGRYRKDISPWVIGYLVGVEWERDTIAYTDHSAAHREEAYQGKYFNTAQGATPFEVLLARVMDEMTAYETEKYGTQRPVGVMTDPSCDFLKYEDVYARQLGKYAFIDPNRICETEAMLAGQMTGYTLFDYCDELERCLAAEQKEALGDLLARMDREEIYGGRLSLIAGYDAMPVLAVYSVSSARGATDIGQPPLTEWEQGERLALISQTLEKDGWAGGMISAWQDGWTRRTWNTAFAADIDQSRLWYDVQTAAKNTGLLAFEPGEVPVCVIDGDKSEWTEKDVISQNGSLRLSVRQDPEGLYLLIEGAGQDQAVYVPLDVSDEVGSAKCDDPALTFSRKADFLLILDGKENSRLLAQERYDAVWEAFLYEMTGEDPFVETPSLDSGRFVPVVMALNNSVLADKLGEETKALQRLGAWETGKLRHGIGQPADENYDSLADFCYGADFAEIRIPWLLLNAGNPARAQFHRDYYRLYGVELKKSREIFLGVSAGGNGGEIAMNAYWPSTWGDKMTYREREKQSYSVMQALWAQP